MLNAIKGSGLRFLWLAIIAFIADQWTKQAVVAHIELYQAIQVTPFFNLTHVHNYGAAFSFLADAGGWQRWFFTTIAVVVSGLLLWWMKGLKRDQVMLSVAFALILGGALGNVYDRLVYGYVIDFLDVYYQQWHWPAFNIADSAICVGAVLLIIDMFKNGDEKNASVQEQ
ncbi:signal peptidase II [Aestuariibacter sp. AA17]|uniref:Lipoprotein signal peptidase n=1 Tax=Fluctibacter corallii TaxID=2984329 RepID=A0ABT3AC11_9ALTE|nr:signal peptidase II [Aestuariibacter sp. AA17]MCV2886127.1 signal peptidase II [Aestuariibacter sp. AA17]